MQAITGCRAIGALVLAAACLGACGCYHQPRGPVKRSEVVGRYVFRMEDSGATYHSPDRLVLEANGTYALTRMPGGRPGPTEKGTWQVYNDLSGGPQVGIGKGLYPIEVLGKQLRLIVEPDLGYYWYKVAK